MHIKHFSDLAYELVPSDDTRIQAIDALLNSNE